MTQLTVCVKKLLIAFVAVADGQLFARLQLGLLWTKKPN